MLGVMLLNIRSCTVAEVVADVDDGQADLARVHVRQSEVGGEGQGYTNAVECVGDVENENFDMLLGSALNLQGHGILHGVRPLWEDDVPQLDGILRNTR